MFARLLRAVLPVATIVILWTFALIVTARDAPERLGLVGWPIMVFCGFATLLAAVGTLADRYAVDIRSTASLVDPSPDEDAES